MSDALNNLVAAVAPLIGAAVQDDEGRLSLVMPNGVKIHATTGYGASRSTNTFCGWIADELSSYHRDYRREGGDGLGHHSIKVSASKVPAAVAADIKRRLLPGLDLGTISARKWKGEADDADARRFRTMSEFAEAIGGKVSRDERGRARSSTCYIGGENGRRIEFETGVSPDDLEITIDHLSAKHAIEVARLLLSQLPRAA